jgi:hypothetical protein
MDAPFSFDDVNETVIAPLVGDNPPEDEAELIKGAFGAVATTVRVSYTLPASKVAVAACRARIAQEPSAIGVILPVADMEKLLQDETL